MKKVRIGLVHATMNSVVPILNAFDSLDESVELVNFMDEGLIYELNENNRITDRMIIRLSDLAGKAAESKVDAILFTCSSFSPYVPKIADLVSVPVLSSDESMLEKAVEQGRRIAVISTIKAAGPTTEKMLRRMADEKDTAIEIDVHVLEEAFEALQNGKKGEHDQLIREKIEAEHASDVIVLAQYSMAGAVQNGDWNKVLTGPGSGAGAIVELAGTNNR